MFASKKHSFNHLVNPIGNLDISFKLIKIQCILISHKLSKPINKKHKNEITKDIMLSKLKKRNIYFERNFCERNIRNLMKIYSLFTMKELKKMRKILIKCLKKANTKSQKQF